MLFCFSVLFAYQILGELVSRFLPIFVPGPVLGMVLLFFSLLMFPWLMKKLESAAMDLLQHLSLLFVPAGVGIMVSIVTLSSAWLAILTSMVMSTILTMVVVAFSFQFLQTKAAVEVKGAKHERHNIDA